MVCAAPSFWQQHGKPAKADDLTGLPALCYTGSERVDAWPYTAPDGTESRVTTTVALRSTSGSFLREAAIAGQGVVLQPSFIVHQATASGQLECALTDHKWPVITIHAVYPETRHLSARARTFIDYVRSRIGPVPAWEKEMCPN